MVCFSVNISQSLLSFFYEAQLYLLPTPTMKKDANTPQQRSGRIDSGETKWSPLFPNFHIGIVIHEIREQQRSEERYVRGASHWSISLKCLT